MILVNLALITERGSPSGNKGRSPNNGNPDGGSISFLIERRLTISTATF